MKSLLNTLTVISFLILSCTGQEVDHDIKSRTRKINIDSLILAQFNNYDIPAIAVGVFDTDSVLVYAYGIRNTIDRTPVNKDDRFHVGSCTKAITSFIAARLVEKGLIKWDTRIIDMFPDLSGLIDPYYKDKTLSDILSHRAGIQPFTSGIELRHVPDSIINYEGSNERQLFSEWLLTQSPAIEEDQKYIYSNAGYSIAATMLEKVSEKTWEILVEEEFFDVFGISGYLGHPVLSDVKQPHGHITPARWGIGDSNDLTPLPDSLKYNLRFMEPAGDISLSLSDYSIFLQEILKALLYNGSKLKQETYDYMFFEYDDYSMGWGNPRQNNIQYLSHDGSDGTFYCRVLISREKEYGLVIMSNAGNDDTVKGIYAISNHINRKIK
ncbi:MAG: beta-lactamase family protein [Bacteroidales bacterium]|nr:beta-lactamase family protein [Bacteroidales bacterium]